MQKNYYDIHIWPIFSLGLMRQKLITLCPNTFEMAQRIGNFSEWVRMKLKEEDLIHKETYLHKCIKGCQKVSEYSASPMCPQHRVRMQLTPSIALINIDKLVE